MLTASLTSAVGILLLVVGLIIILFIQKRKKNLNMQREGKDLELPFFKLSTILKATHHFSTDNKLGEGGFGSVYKVR